jgi:hypothetical protein
MISQIVQAADRHAREASMGSVDDTYLATPNNVPSDLGIAFENADSGGPDGVPAYRFGVAAYGYSTGVVGCGGKSMTRILGPYSTSAGVHGTSPYFTGVAGTSVNHVGVYGQVEERVPVPYGLHAGVLGTGASQPGVIGHSTDYEGVLGQSYRGNGVRGDSAISPGIIGDSGRDSGVIGASGDFGPAVGMGVPTIAGVWGTSDQRPGVSGTSNALWGVYGFSTFNVGVVGETANPQSYAGYFAGNVHITGTVSYGFKAAVVAFPDGTQRMLHGMESPEPWFEDFGAAKLKRGRAMVKLDADFAKVITRGDYHVFLTPRGDCRGLYVRSQSGASFEVRELGGGTSSVAFSYRIVAHRKDIKGQKRFPKVDTRLPIPARGRRRPPTLRAFIADVEKRARAKATPAMRKSDREVAAMPVPDLKPSRVRAPARASG